MKRITLVIFVAFMLAFGVSGGQAALIGLSTSPDMLTLPSTLGPGPAGSFDFGVYLIDKGALPNIDTFNLSLQVTGTSGLTMPAAEVKGPTLTNYIFYGNNFAFIGVNPGGDLSKLGVGDTTSNGNGVNPSAGHNLMAMITLHYPALTAETALNFSLQPPDQNFALSSGGALENLTLGASPVPIPGAIWLLATGVMGLIGVRRKFLKQ